MIDPRTALDAIGQLVDTEIDIAGAALQLARIDAPDADWARAGRHLSDIARKAAVLRETDLIARAEALADLLAHQFGYAGDMETYDDPANANLIRVTERRRGLPVALGIIWLHAARAAGWECHGVDFPAHFLIALDATRKQVIVDVFHGGRIMPVRDLIGLLKQVEGPGAEMRPGLLRPMNNRRVLLRLQNNIMTRRLAAGDLEGSRICAEDMVRFAPDQAHLLR
jgi:regulator of sirC expression with transglutaminase-like and TPR domain